MRAPRKIGRFELKMKTEIPQPLPSSEKKDFFGGCKSQILNQNEGRGDRMAEDWRLIC